ncbi:MAG: serine--tRNA ligase [Actinomycetota bacterium]
MLDLRLIREDPEGVKAALARRGAGREIDEILELDARRRDAQSRADDLRAEQKREGKAVAKLQGEEKQALLARLKELSAAVDAAQTEEAESAERLQQLLLVVPNIPHESMPDGQTEDDNEILRVVGEPPTFDFEPKDHLDLGEALGVIDMEAGARTSGSRFTYLKGSAAKLWWAVARYAVGVCEEAGFTFVLPPVLVRRDAMEGTGFFPAGADQIYTLPDDELYLVGTAEVPLGAAHMGEIIEPDELPIRYVGHSACFRREAGAAGKDTRGIFRLHQFEKVEMFAFVRPEDSWAEHDKLVAIEEKILQDLELPYRAVALCGGDLGAPSAKTIDLEVWFPGQQRYRETTSCSNTTDYQARRLNTRMRTEGGTEIVHTLNGTAATSSRTVAAIMENHQTADGRIVVPKVLRDMLGTDALG